MVPNVELLDVPNAIRSLVRLEALLTTNDRL